MIRRSFLQSLAGAIAAAKAYCGTRLIEARAPSPTGWKIDWHDLPESPTSAGYWLALPETSDRHIAFRVLVPRTKLELKREEIKFTGSGFFGLDVPEYRQLSQSELFGAKIAGRDRIFAMIHESRNAVQFLPSYPQMVSGGVMPGDPDFKFVAAPARIPDTVLSEADMGHFQRKIISGYDVSGINQ